MELGPDGNDSLTIVGSADVNVTALINREGLVWVDSDFAVVGGTGEPCLQQLQVFLSQSDFTLTLHLYICALIYVRPSIKVHAAVAAARHQRRTVHWQGSVQRGMQMALEGTGARSAEPRL